MLHVSSQALQQVYPTEAREPDGLLSSITLRPYQRQSLAFMLAIERGENKDGAGEVWVEPFGEAYRRRSTTRAAEKHRAKHGANATAPGRNNAVTRKMVKLLDNIPPVPKEQRQVRSGWLCDESVLRHDPLYSLAFPRPDLEIAWMCVPSAYVCSQWAWARLPS